MSIESTAVFKANISSLKKEMQAAARAVKLADAEFKAATAGMDNWSSSANGLEAKLKQLDTTLTSQKQKLNLLKDELQNTVSVYGENSAAADRVRIAILNQEAAIAKTESEIQKYSNALDEVKSAADKAADGTDEYKSASDELKSTISEQENKLEELKKRYADLQLEEQDTSQESDELAREIKDLSNELKENKQKLSDAERAADEFDDSLDEVDDSAEKATQGFTVMKAALANLVADGIRAALEGLKELAQQTYEAGSGFEKGMSQVQALSGASAEDIEALTAKAKEMGETTQFSASESAEAFNYMAMAGWTTEEMLDGIAGIMALAAASGEDLGTTSDIVTDALTAMGYSAGDAGRLADVMAAASSNANTNVALMGATFQYAAPILGALGYNMEDAAVAIGLMANAGIKGEKAGTALRSMLTRLSAPPKECADAMEELGISLTDSEGNMKDLDTVMQDLREAFDGLSETQQTQYAKAIAGQEAMSGLLAIVNAAPQDFEKLTAAVRNSNGAAEEMAKTMLDNVGGDITLLQSKIEGLMISVYEKAAPKIRKGIEQISQALDKVNWDKVAEKVGDAFQKLIDIFSWFVNNSGSVSSALKTIATIFVTYAVASTVASVTAAFKALFTMVSNGTSVFTAFTTVLELSPFAVVAAGIAGVIVAMKEWNDAAKEATEAEYGLNEEQQASVTASKNLKSEYDQMIRARENSLAGIDAEYSYIEQLVEEYNNLIDSNGEVKDGYEDRANFILTELAKALGVEREEIEKNIQKNGELGDSIDKLIEKKRAEATLSALESDYTTAIGKRSEALQTYQEAQKTADEAEQKYKQTLEDNSESLAYYQELLETQPDAANAYYAANRKVFESTDAAKQAYEEAQSALADAEAAYIGYNATIQNYEGLASAIISGDTNKIETALNKASNSFITAEAGTKESLERQVDYFEKNYEAMKQAVADGMPGVTQEQVKQAENLVKLAKYELDKLETVGREAGETLPDSVSMGISSGAYAVPESVEEMETLVSYDDLVQKAKDAGIEVPQEIANGIATGETKPAEALEQLTNLADFMTLVEKSEAAGVQVPQYIADGIISGEYAPQEAVAMLASYIDYNNLVTQAEEAGIEIPEEIKAGIDSGNTAPSSAIGEIIALVNEELDKSAEQAGESGSNYTIGYADGILSVIDNATGAATSLGESSLQSLREAIEEGSPSRATQESGENFTEGFANGIENRESSATSAAERLAQKALEALEKLEPEARKSGEQAGRAHAEGLSGQKSQAQQSGKTVGEAGVQGEQTGSNQSRKAGEKTGTDYRTGLSSQSKNASSAGQTVGQSAVQGEQSGASGANSAGSTTGSNYNSGVSSQAGGAYSAGATLASNASSGASTGYSGAYSSGTNFAQGFIDGISSLVGSVASAAANLVTSAINAAKSAQAEGSPSKLTYKSGVNFTLGYINGIASQQKNLIKTVKSLITTATDYMLQMKNWNFGTVAEKASASFADAISKDTDYLLDKITYQNEAKLADFDKTIANLQKEQKKKADKLNSENTAWTNKKQAKSDEKIAKIEAKRDANVKKLQDQIDKLSSGSEDAAKKKELNAKIKTIKENASKQIKEEKAATKKLLANGKAELKKNLAANETNYKKLIAEQEKYKEAYQTASQAMLSEFSKAINDYQQQAQALIDSTIKGIENKYNERYDDLLSKQEDLIEKMQSAKDLFEISGAGIMTVNDLKAQTEAINEYASKLQQIKEKVSAELFDQIASYDMAEGSAFLDRLLAMSAEDLTAYNKAYTDKMEAAQKAGEKIYKADFEKIASDYQSEVNKAFAKLPKALETLGTQAMQGFVDGLTKNTDYLDKNVKTFVQGMVDQFKKQLKIKSPSKVMFDIGEYTGEGFEEGLLSVVKSIQETASDIAEAVTSPLKGVKSDLSGIGSAIGKPSSMGIYGASGATTQTVNNYNLVQNNNSPRPLTALETYQARRQQIALVKAYA